MSFLRPEALRKIKNWRGVILALALLMTGLWITGNSFGFFYWFGCAVILLGLILAFYSWQRARLLSLEAAPGVLRVVEDQLMYLGPKTGGTVALDDIEQISLLGRQDERFWEILTNHDETLRIPIGAQGHELAFDAFARLPNWKWAGLPAIDPKTNHKIMWQRETNAQKLSSLLS